MKHSLLILFFFVFSQTLLAKDLGYRYQDGKCINAKGEQGYNPQYFGQCGNLSGVVLGNFDLRGVDFSGSLLENVIFSGSQLDEVNFTGCNLQGANLSGVSANGVDFTRANLKGVRLKNAKLGNSYFQYTNFESVNLEKVIFDYSEFHSVNLKNTTLSEASFNKSTIVASDFSGANGEAVDFSKTKISNTNFSKSHMNSSQFSNSILTEVTFVKAELKQVSFNNSTLNKVDYSEADLRSSSFDKTKNWETSKFFKALFNKQALLPFDIEEAQNKYGMLFQNLSVFVIWSEEGNTLDHFKSLLDRNSVNYEISKGNEDTFTGESIADHTSVIYLASRVGNCSNVGQDLPEKGQKALVDFVKNGGQFIYTEWVACSTSYNELQFMRDLVIIDRNSESGGSITLTPAPEQKNHPIWKDLPDRFEIEAHFNVGQTMMFAEQPAQALVKDENGYDQVSVRNFGTGQIVGFGIACNERHRCMENKNVQKLFMNALKMN